MSRSLIANVTVSLDGYIASPGGGMEWLARHAVDPGMSAYFAGVFTGCDTALLGRVNYEGFHGYWPPVAADPAASYRDRDLARWLDEVEKVVFSRTLTEATWRNSRIATDPVAEVTALKAKPGRDIVILSSASLIRQLLAADLVDELRLNQVPAILGDGMPLFDGGQPASTWRLAGNATLDTGCVGLRYRRD
ncbi:dihydrofolate reductase [Stackebrandtia albiflava]|uniref:Dihydrofolate reductase n=1 Tax=Stackebrandtia albiflava TaxID=406432 RepID=A0A562V1V5_9ACTN|nr:dihydrofolate reductase family protein [Stackebrandtia albiflava]TWJ11858.1 dihydrofolate reductase [Stackebrandtia albiflava]